MAAVAATALVPPADSYASDPRNENAPRKPVLSGLVLGLEGYDTPLALGTDRDQDVLTYDDVHVNFTQEEWALLNPSQKSLYHGVMLETYRNLSTIGYIWEDNTTEEYCKSSRGHGR
ncbi:zinc finger protein 431-like [Rattus rattus]|uniref:zinc finger protein 431-like n=1 Tax=Rattus rattus TaxID=10117 RepID=UPI0013F30E18|nr:zinc finger protein 431-like [Rattus rattus]